MDTKNLVAKLALEEMRLNMQAGMNAGEALLSAEKATMEPASA